MNAMIWLFPLLLKYSLVTYIIQERKTQTTVIFNNVQQFSRIREMDLK